MIENKSYQIYGILNVTPDSFSDGGNYTDPDAALRHALMMIGDGADVIDIGGMSTRPGFEDVPEDEEISRIVPVIGRLKKERPDCVISVDTFRSGTAARALDAGADIINDISGLMGDQKMADTVSKAGAGIIIMRNGLVPYSNDYHGVFAQSIMRAREAGIGEDKIILDPGVGFGTTRDEDIHLISAVSEIRLRWGYPVLLGVSRKRVTSLFYNGTTRADERDGASVAMAVYGVRAGAYAVRVHNVKQTYAALKAMEALERGA